MINKTFTAIIGEDTGKDDWTCVVWRESVSVLGTGKAVKVVCTVDGHELQKALLPTGKGTHMISLNKSDLKTLNKQMGDEVEVLIKERV